MQTSPSARLAAGVAALTTPSAAGRRRAGLVGLSAVLCGTLAGCYASQNAQTLKEIPDTPGVDGAVGMIVLDDVYLDSAATVPAGGSLALRGAFTEESSEPDQLVAVTTPVAASVELLAPDGSPATGGIAVPGDGQVDATTGAVLLRLTGLTRALTTQATVPITFEFARAGRVTLDDVPAATTVAGEE
jgi:copper(I)-binding protein